MTITIMEGAMNTSAKGNGAELKTARLLASEGWLVASRRHIGGAADLLAIKPNHQPRLIEVKARKSLWEGFRREDRVALIAEAERFGAVAECCWWRPRASEPVWLGVDAWPN